MRVPHALIAVPVLSAVGLAAIAGAGSVALFALPFLMLAALLLSGRFVGEERILAYRAARRGPAARRAAAPRWRTPRPERARSLFARAPRTLRGPPALASA
jgi:hypothetical protein